VTITSSTKSDVTTPTSGTAVFYGSLTDIGSTDADANHLLDSVDYKYFGRLGTLPGNAAGQLSYRTTGHSPSTDQPIWSSFNDPNYVYNTTCWLYGVAGLTAFSPFNTYSDVTRAGTLITPRHAVIAMHDEYYIPPGYQIRFVDLNNTTYTRTVLGYSRIVQNFDYGLIVLDSDLPASVGFVKVLPYEALHKLTPSQELWYGASCPSSTLPAIGFNRRKEAFIFDAYSFDALNLGMSGQSSLWFPTWGSFCRRNPNPPCSCTGYDLVVGDSGHPAYLLLNNELVLIGPWYSCADVSSWQGSSITALNQTIVNLDTAAFGRWTGYSATPYAVSGFPSLW
jgi:hypothetical protein